MVIDFSGGINTQKNLEIAFDSGAAYASIGSIAVQDEFTFSGWLLAFDPRRFIIGADVRGEQVVIRGWTQKTSLDVYQLIEKYTPKGVTQYFCTDVNKDGLLEGPSVDLYKQILEKFPSIDLIASGGISSLADLDQLKEIGCSGAIIGKAIYENKISLAELTRYN
jgi:phosphoribosylformimino-5-aminoimidazole carboxamide ribotide isomerase